MPPGGELREVKANVLKEELSAEFMKTSQSSNHLKVREHQQRSFIHSLIHSFLIKDLYYMLGTQGSPCFGYIREHSRHRYLLLSSKGVADSELNLINT